MHDILTPSTDCGFSEPSPIFPYRPGPKVGKRSAGLQRKSHARELPSSIAWLRSRRTIARIIVAIAPFVCQIAASTVFDRARAHRLRRVLSPSIGSPNSSRRRPIALPFRRAGSVP